MQAACAGTDKPVPTPLPHTRALSGMRDAGGRSGLCWERLRAAQCRGSPALPPFVQLFCTASHASTEGGYHRASRWELTQHCPPLSAPQAGGRYELGAQDWPAGCLGYAYNLIRPVARGQRGGVLAGLLGPTLVFETLAHASAYREFMTQASASAGGCREMGAAVLCFIVASSWGGGGSQARRQH